MDFSQKEKQKTFWCRQWLWLQESQTRWPEPLGRRSWWTPESLSFCCEIVTWPASSSSSSRQPLKMSSPYGHNSVVENLRKIYECSPPVWRLHSSLSLIYGSASLINNSWKTKNAWWCNQNWPLYLGGYGKVSDLVKINAIVPNSDASKDAPKVTHTISFEFLMCIYAWK